MKDPLKDAKGWPISNGDVRFAKRFMTPALPKPGEFVNLMIRPDVTFQATVVRSDWHEEKQLFVVSCRYSGVSIPRPEYLALMEDHDWTRKALWGARTRGNAPVQ